MEANTYLCTHTQQMQRETCTGKAWDSSRPFAALSACPRPSLALQSSADSGDREFVRAGRCCQGRWLQECSNQCKPCQDVRWLYSDFLAKSKREWDRGGPSCPSLSCLPACRFSRSSFHPCPELCRPFFPPPGPSPATSLAPAPL